MSSLLLNNYVDWTSTQSTSTTLTKYCWYQKSISIHRIHKNVIYKKVSIFWMEFHIESQNVSNVSRHRCLVLALNRFVKIHQGILSKLLRLEVRIHNHALVQKWFGWILPWGFQKCQSSSLIQYFLRQWRSCIALLDWFCKFQFFSWN